MDFIDVKLFLDKEYSPNYTRGIAIDTMFDLILKRLKELDIQIFNIKDFYRDFLIYIITYSDYEKNIRYN